MTELRIGTLLDLNQLQKVLDDFSEATGFATVAVDPRGLPVTQPSGFTDFCKAMRSDPVRSKLCHGCDAHGGLQSLIDGKPRVYRCHAGLVDFSVSVAADDTYVGAILCGQVQVPVADQPDFLTTGPSWANDPQLEELYRQVPVISARRVTAALDTLLGVSMELDGSTVKRRIQRGGADETPPSNRYRPLTLVAVQPPAPSAEVPAVATVEQREPELSVNALHLLRDCLAQEDLPGAIVQLELLLEAAQTSPDPRERLVALEDHLVQVAQDCSPRLVPHLSQVIQRHRKSSRSYLDRYASQLYFERILGMILEEGRRSRPQRRRDIRDLLNDIALHPAKAISLTDAATSLHWSPGHLSKLFKSVTGCTFVSYVTARRISRARLMLASTQMPVRKIATELDFTQVNYFSRVFRAYTGLSPSEYRRQRSMLDRRPAGVSLSAHHDTLLRA